MIKAQQAFFWTSNLKGQGFYCNKANILYFISETFCVVWKLSVLSEKLYFLEVGPVREKLWSF